MTYGASDTVKVILEIASAITTYDTEIAACITSSDALVDSKLLKLGLFVPLAPTPTPQNIIDASNYYCAWAFRHRRDPTGAEAFWSEAEKFLTAYVDSQPETTGSMPFAVGTINIDDNRVDDGWS